MQINLEKAVSYLKPNLFLVLPLILWLSLWLSIQSMAIENILHPESPVQFLHGLRGTFPYLAAVLAVLLMFRTSSPRFNNSALFSSPLALTTMYGLIGVGTALASPDLTTALKWVALYLIVPLILWAAMWGNAPLDRIGRIIQLNGLIIILGFVILFVVGLFQLRLGELILDPPALFRCEKFSHWYIVSSGLIRGTGVGRIAAVSALIALGMVSRSNLRMLWFIILLGSIALLLNTGARSSIAGFAAAAPFVVLLHFGKKAVIGGALGIVVLVPMMWATGIHKGFLQNCILTGTDVSGISYLKLQSATPSVTPDPSGQAEDSRLSIPSASLTATGRTPDPSGQAEDSRLSIPRGFYTATGRTIIWSSGWEFIKLSPAYGYGFHADRLVLGTHMHNAVLQSLIQTGFVGAIPFVAAILFAWALLFKAIRKLDHIAGIHKTLVIQTAGLLTFLSFRSFFESTGAFFGIDWLLLSPLLLYLRLVDSTGDSGVGNL